MSLLRGPLTNCRYYICVGTPYDPIEFFITTTPFLYRRLQ